MPRYFPKLLWLHAFWKQSRRGGSVGTLFCVSFLLTVFLFSCKEYPWLSSIAHCVHLRFISFVLSMLFWKQKLFFKSFFRIVLSENVVTELVLGLPKIGIIQRVKFCSFKSTHLDFLTTNKAILKICIFLTVFWSISISEKYVHLASLKFIL